MDYLPLPLVPPVTKQNVVRGLVFSAIIGAVVLALCVLFA